MGRPYTSPSAQAQPLWLPTWDAALRRNREGAHMGRPYTSPSA